MKRLGVCFVICLSFLGLTGCRGASANTLITEARLEHGSANVVSKTKTSDGYVIVLHDNLQNFDYTVQSYMNAETLDGSELWKVPAQSDDFQYVLIDKIITDEQANINTIETTYGVKFVNEYCPTVYADDKASAQQAAYEIAVLFQNNNMENRIDDLRIQAIAPDSYYFDRTGKYGREEESTGYYILPSLTWSGADEELIEEYTYIAQELDPGAKYLRSEEMSFADTGYDLDQVTLTGDAPSFEDAPVTYFYFEASDGGEFYVADFCINNKYRPSEFFEANNYDNRVY